MKKSIAKMVIATPEQWSKIKPLLEKNNIKVPNEKFDNIKFVNHEKVLPLINFNRLVKIFNYEKRLLLAVKLFNSIGLFFPKREGSYILEASPSFDNDKFCSFMNRHDNKQYPIVQEDTDLTPLALENAYEVVED